MTKTKIVIAVVLIVVRIGLPSYAQAAATVSDAAHPDLSGVWQIEAAPKALRTLDGSAPPLLPQAQTTYSEYLSAKKARDASYDTMSKCLPPGVPRIFLQPFPFRIQQQSNLIAMIFQWNHLDRLIYLDTAHFEAVAPAYLGQSVGKWEGGTLIVDNTDFNDQTLLDDSGLPHSDALHIVERYVLKNAGKTLEIRFTIEDPQTFSKPWETVLHFKRQSLDVRDDDFCLGRIGKEPMNLQ